MPGGCQFTQIRLDRLVTYRAYGTGSGWLHKVARGRNSPR